MKKEHSMFWKTDLKYALLCPLFYHFFSSPPPSLPLPVNTSLLILPLAIRSGARHTHIRSTDQDVCWHGRGRASAGDVHETKGY